jgi:hypothetical protein
MTARRHDICPQCGRPFSEAERRARKNSAIAKGQRIAWLNPDIRARRTAAIQAAFDDPLVLAVMRRRKERQP